MRILYSLIFLLLLSSCATQRFIVDDKFYRARNATHEEVHHFILWGVGQEEILNNPAKYCKEGEKLASVELILTVPDYLLRTITFGIYWPRSVKVYCIKEIKANKV